MISRFVIMSLMTVSALGCATSQSASDSKAGLLCIEKTDGTGEVVHCLNPFSVDAAAVE